MAAPKQCSARFGQFSASAFGDKKRCSDKTFKGLHLLGDGRLRASDDLGRGSETAGFINGDQRSQIREV